MRGDIMNKRLSLGQDEFISDDIVFGANNFVELNDENEFHNHLQTIKDATPDEEVEPLEDEEFYALIQELDTLSDENLDIDTKTNVAPLSLAQENFELEKELAYEKLRLEREILEHEKAKLQSERKAFELMMKLSQESFQTEKDQYEIQKKIEKEKMYLETMEIINSCTNFSEFLENYKKIQDVSE